MERPARAKRDASKGESMERIPQRTYPTEEQIRVRAYQIYIERGRAPGHALDDWLRAERELRSNR
jgi:hypothetical protein